MATSRARTELNVVLRIRPVYFAAVLLPAAVAGADPTCPAGTSAVGSAPPAGREWKCVAADGSVDGPWLTWYDSGQLMSERQLQKGREHGRQRSWWPNGQLMMEGVSYQGNRYQGFKYWTITGAPTELHMQTETVGAPPAAPAQPR